MPVEKNTPPRQHRSHQRPFGLRVFCILLWFTGGGHWLAALRVALYSSSYTSLDVSFSPVVRVAAGIFWGTLLMWAGWHLCFCRNESRHPVFLVIGAYAITQALWWRLYFRSDYALARLPFVVLSTGVLVMLAFWYIYRLRQ